VSLNHHILIVDDDKRIRELLTKYLDQHGYRTSAAASAAEARDQMRGIVFDLLILDVMMPGESGTSLASSLRGKGSETPILMLSALADTSDRIKGLASGSDDYLAKPFEPEELLLRIKNILRRTTPVETAAKWVRLGECKFDVELGDLSRFGETIRLTGREKEMLRILVKKAGSPVARGELATGGQDESARAVDVQINRLRHKIETDPANPLILQTVRGEGYVLYIEAID
jgi:two-component system, OmpR family, phosphate regulon response regulator OmpR